MILIENTGGFLSKMLGDANEHLPFHICIVLGQVSGILSRLGAKYGSIM